MTKKIAIGIQDFEELREENYFRNKSNSTFIASS